MSKQYTGGGCEQTIDVLVEFIKSNALENNNGSQNENASESINITDISHPDQNLTINEGEDLVIIVNFSRVTDYSWIINNQTVVSGTGDSASYNFSADFSSSGNYTLRLIAGNLTREWNITVKEAGDLVFEFRTAVLDYNTEAYIPNNTVTINGVTKQNPNRSSHYKTIFNVSSDTLTETCYSADNYLPDCDDVYFDMRLTTCTAGSDCNLGTNKGGYTTNCVWNSDWGDFTCTVTKADYKSVFIYNPNQNAVKRVNYLEKK